MRYLATIALVAYNEGPTIRNCLDTITSSAEKQAVPIEIIAISNGSTDTTLEEMERWKNESPLDSIVSRKVMELGENLRFSGGLLAGVERAQSEWVLSYSADIFFSSEDLKRFIDVVMPASGKTDEDISKIGAVVGVRTHRPGYSSHVKFLSYIYNLLLRIIFHIPLRDFNWVCLYRRSLLEGLKIKSRSVFFHAEILIRMKRNGYILPSVDAPVFERTHGKPTVSKPATWKAIVIDFWNFITIVEQKNE